MAETLELCMGVHIVLATLCIMKFIDGFVLNVRAELLLNTKQESAVLFYSLSVLQSH